MLHDRVVEVIPSQEGVPRGGDHLEHIPHDVKNRNIESAATEVIDDDVLVLCLPESIGKRGRRGLIDDPQDLKPCDPSCVSRRLTRLSLT